jgi:hypothetical protein
MGDQPQCPRQQLQGFAKRTLFSIGLRARSQLEVAQLKLNADRVVLSACI